jgi:nucleoid-associated protein YgaU
MSNSPDRASHAPQTEEEEANTPESVLQRLRDERSRGGPIKLLGWSVPWPVIVGAVAIVLLAMAFVLRPGDETPDPATAAAPPPATATAVPAAAAPPTPAPEPTRAPAPTQERIHTVESGDTLSLLAEKYYNDASKWKVIFEANGDVLESPDSLQLGQALKIPN